MPRFSPAEKLLGARELRAMFSYDTKTGALRWKYRPEMRPQWNARYAGQVAGSVSCDGYRRVRVTVGGREHSLLAHRIAFCMREGVWPEGDIDHHGEGRDDNREGSIRAATRPQNAQHRTKIWSATEIKGVSWHKGTQKYRASIMVNGMATHLGYFETPWEGGLVYDQAARKYHGEFAGLNADIQPTAYLRFLFRAFAL